MPATIRPEVALARRLRREMSLPEILLWQQLRGGKLRVSFRKQHPIGPYVADFYCPVARLIVEVDGEAHSRSDRPQRDEARDRFLVENGYEIMRVSAREVLDDMDAVMITWMP